MRQGVIRGLFEIIAIRPITPLSNHPIVKMKLNLKSIPSHEDNVIKGILHQKNFYRLNLIFWIVMGCGIARFGRRGLKTTET